jgi:protein-arginine kinase activator protein McsA
MKCERCRGREEAAYRVRSDVIDMKVCAACADEARNLGLAVEAIDGEKKAAESSVTWGVGMPDQKCHPAASGEP